LPAACIIEDEGALGELQVDAVAVAVNGVAGYFDFPGAPQMDAVAGRGLTCSAGRDVVVRDLRTANSGQIDGEKVVGKPVAVDYDSVCLLYQNGGVVTGVADARIPERHAAYLNTVGQNLEDESLVLRVDNRKTLTGQGQFLADHQLALMIGAGHNADGGSRFGPFNGFRDRGNRALGAHHQFT
jgi:hypothetical protein